MVTVKNPVSLVEHRDSAKATLATRKDLGWECFSQQVLLVPKCVSAQWLIASTGLETPVSMVTQALRLLCSPPPPHPLHQLHWRKDFSIRCLGKPGFYSSFRLGSLPLV